MKKDRLTTAYPELCRKRIIASKALSRLLAVADGEQAADKDRDSVCRALLDKVLPDLKATEHTGSVAHTFPGVHIHPPGG